MDAIPVTAGIVVRGTASFRRPVPGGDTLAVEPERESLYVAALPPRPISERNDARSLRAAVAAARSMRR